MKSTKNKIIKTVDKAYADSNKYFVKKARNVLETLAENIKNPQLGDVDYQLDEAVKFVSSYKDASILDEVQSDTLSKFTDNDITDLDEYDETCDLRTEYQQDINEDIDEIIEQMKELVADHKEGVVATRFMPSNAQSKV